MSKRPLVKVTVSSDEGEHWVLLDASDNDEAWVTVGVAKTRPAALADALREIELVEAELRRLMSANPEES